MNSFGNNLKPKDENSIVQSPDPKKKRSKSPAQDGELVKEVQKEDHKVKVLRTEQPEIVIEQESQP